MSFKIDCCLGNNVYVYQETDPKDRSIGALDRFFQGITNIFIKIFFKEPKEQKAENAIDYTIVIDKDIKISVTVLTNPEAQEGRFMLYSGGFFQRKEDTNNQVLGLMQGLKTSAVLFNYAGMGKSEGVLLHSKTVEKTHHVITEFMEEVLEANQKIVYGYSMGGLAITAEEGSSAVFVIDRSANSSKALASDYFASWFLKLLGFQLDVFKKLQKAGIKPIVLQTADVEAPCVLDNAKLLVKNDDFVSKKASLANKIFDQKYNDAVVIGIKDRHFEDLTDVQLLSQKVEEKLVQR